MNPFDDADIIEGTQPGGANTSRSMQLPALINLLGALPADAGLEQYQSQAVDQNLLGKSTYEGRRRAFRYLRENFILDPRRIVFRSLRDLWGEAPHSRPLLAGLCAFARDSVYRATGDAVLTARPGDRVGSDQLVAALRIRFAGTYSDEYARKIARNTGASWSQSGHLTNGAAKRRRGVAADAPATAYALLLGYLQGLRGQALLATPWLQFLDLDEGRTRELAGGAARRGYLEYREAGEVIDITFKHLLRGLQTQ